MRESGILMHISSLPGPYGIGTLGRCAYEFVDFLKKAGQNYWQLLPLSPTGYGDSPYQSCSAYAGNPYFVDLSTLAEEGLLTREELEAVDWGSGERVDFGILYRQRFHLLRRAFARFTDWAALDQFCTEQCAWLPDFALFMALKGQEGGKPWYQWPEGLKRRQPEAMWQARQELKADIRFYSFVQYLFFKQWTALSAYAHTQGIRFIGDVPIYVPYDSVEVWAEPELFRLDEDMNPTEVAGVPPDGFTADGQLWGNPLYRWEKMKKDGYSWWLRRLGAAGRLYDIVRMDHFRGLESYWVVPAGDTTARNGHWEQGPGLDFVQTVQQALPALQLIAEDLGYLTPAVRQLRDEAHLPGMKVLAFAFDSREPSDYLPHSYTADSVCYTGTHDNVTMRQWFDTAAPDAKSYATEYMHLCEEEGLVWGVIRTAMSSVSRLCVIPMQDYLDLGAEARMNFPGTLSSANWTWRACENFAADGLAEKICRLTKLYGRG